MHEVSIARSIIDEVKKSCSRKILVRIEKINIKIGQATCVSPESLDKAFTALKKDTPLENAELNIKKIPLEIKCRECRKKTRDAQWPVLLCGSCSSNSVDIITGRELRIDTVEIDDSKRQF